jgi:phosphatidate cytidylyltransferase
MEEVPRPTDEPQAGDDPVTPEAEAEPPAEPEPEPEAVEPSPEQVRRRRETAARVLFAIPWIIFAIAIVAAGGVVFAAALIGLGAIGLREFFEMADRWRPLAPVAYVTLAAMILAAHFGDQFQVLLFAVTGFPVMFVLAARRQDRTDITLSLATTVFAVAWLGLPLVHAVLLRDLPLHGGALLIDVLICTFLTDTAAYGAGRLFGSRKITPRLSPNKTLEGLVGGFVGGVLGFWFAGLYQDWLSGVDALLMGACIAALAPVGDLFASMVKRDFDVKDTGRIFGPHGGLIDRLDAVLFTVVAGYYLSLALVY